MLGIETRVSTRDFTLVNFQLVNFFIAHLCSLILNVLFCFWTNYLCLEHCAQMVEACAKKALLFPPFYSETQENPNCTEAVADCKRKSECSK